MEMNMSEKKPKLEDNIEVVEQPDDLRSQNDLEEVIDNNMGKLRELFKNEVIAQPEEQIPDLDPIKEYQEVKHEFVQNLAKEALHGATRNVFNTKGEQPEKESINKNRGVFKINKSKPTNNVNVTSIANYK